MEEMEDVEKRRQRLAAMREQAALQADNSVPLLGPNILPSSPLGDRAGDSAAPEAGMTGSRFDFYTDPLAGFVGTKRRKPGPAPRNSPPQNSTPYQEQPGIFPTALQPAGFYPPVGPPAWQPIPYQPPPGMPGYVPQPPAPPPQYYPPPAPHHARQFFNPPYGRGFERGHGYVGGGGGPQSGPGRGSGASGRGRGGRGDGRGHVTNDGRGGRGFSSPGRHVSSHSRGVGRAPVSAESQPHLFFKKSMVEDPWQHLEHSIPGRTP